MLVTHIIAQENTLWYRFDDNKTDLIGFKDANQNIKIKPKFLPFVRANQFDKIIAVAESRGDSDAYYYLTKTGKTVGIDKLHFFDNGVDCESEGFIRFRDHKIDKVGLFDGDGSIAISPDKKYPVMTVVIDGRKNSEYVQDHFEFLRIEEGYKLIGISIRSEN